MDYLSLLDIVALLIMVISVVTAFHKGFLIELISLASVIAGLLAAFFYYPTVVHIAEAWSIKPPIGEFLSFLVVFLSVVLLGSILSVILNRILLTLHVKWIDRFLGLGFGIVRGFLVVMVLFLALAAFPVYRGVLSESRLAEFFLTAARGAITIAPSDLQERFLRSYQELYEQWIEETKQSYESTSQIVKATD